MKLNWIVGSAAAMLMLAGQSHAALDMEAGKALAKKSGCFACHSVEAKRVGPAWNDVAEKYKADAGAKDNLVKWIHSGGKGRWNMGAMPAYSPRVADADIDALADFILSLKK
ncbi:MAG: c-type cytochrome [Gammaproteobacteria bacterium]